MAPRGNEPPEPKRMGRPTKYEAEFPKKAEKLCLLGATDVDLADFFEVDVTTIWRWATRYEDFRNALKAGKEAADQRVERSLYQRAVGYTFDAVKVFMPGGATAPVYAPYREHVTPDTTAAIFWLKNRKKDEWRDKSETTLKGDAESPVVQRVEYVVIDPANPGS